MGSRVLWFVGGVGLGFALAFRMRAPVESSCCVRVAAGARDRAGEACGLAGGICQKVGDTIGIWDHVPAILDAWGIKP